MKEKIHVRVTVGPDGRVINWELMVDGLKICDLSYLETLQMAMQATSSLRWKDDASR